jgi:myo-inositol-1(or 4)-monophosphatase
MDIKEIENILPEITFLLKEIAKDIPLNKSTIFSEKDKDIKLSTDLLLHQQIVDMLKNFGDIAVLSEEDDKGVDFSKNKEMLWIIDPLDGSLNHLRKIPLSCISISLFRGITPVMGIIYDYNRNEMFTGIIGAGAWLNTVPIKVSSVRDLGQGVLCTGFPSYRDFSEAAIYKFVTDIRKWKKVRLLGSAALSLAYVASGRTDGYIEEDIRIWDVAAGLAIVKAAGGEIACKPNIRANFVTAKATNASIPIGELI